MFEIKKETLQKAYKPYDIVTDSENNVGFIQEVSVNDSQNNFDSQIQYSVNWLIGHNKIAWFDHNELKRHCNLFIKIAESSCHPMGHNDSWIEKLFKNFN
jgi:hypothetical protein